LPARWKRAARVIHLRVPGWPLDGGLLPQLLMARVAWPVFHRASSTI